MDELKELFKKVLAEENTVFFMTILIRVGLFVGSVAAAIALGINGFFFSTVFFIILAITVLIYFINEIDL